MVRSVIVDKDIKSLSARGRGGQTTESGLGSLLRLDIPVKLTTWESLRQWSHSRKSRSIKLLLQAGANLEAQDRQGSTPLPESIRLGPQGTHALASPT